MFGLLNENTKQFEGFVSVDVLWMHILPGYQAVEMNQAQANAIASSLNLEEPKSPEIISAKLVDGKIFTGKRLLETPTRIRISKPNYEHFAESQIEVPEKYYVIDDYDESEEEPVPDMTRKELKMAVDKCFDDVSTVKEMQFAFEVRPSVIMDYNVENWCGIFGPEVVITEIKKNSNNEILGGLLNYALHSNDKEIIEWIISNKYVIHPGHISATKLPEDYIIPNMIKIIGSDEFIKLVVVQQWHKWMKYISDMNILEYEHLEYACRYGLNKTTKIIYDYVDSAGKMNVDSLMDIAADNADIQLMKFLHQKKYIYNIAELFEKYSKFMRHTTATNTALRRKYHSVIEEFVRQWSISSPFDKFERIHTHSGYKKIIGEGRNIPSNSISLKNSCASSGYYNTLQGILKNYTNWWKYIEDYSDEELIKLFEKDLERYNDNTFSLDGGYFTELIKRGVFHQKGLQVCKLYPQNLIWKCMLHNGFNPYEC